MKLTKIEIIHFGKLNNRTFNLQDKLNVFFGQNEAGKSTTVAFIKQILFGFHLKNNKSQFFEDYVPLNKVSPMGGRLYFKDGNDNFVLERLYATGQSKKGVLTVTLNNQQVPEDIFFSRINNIDSNFYTDSFIFNQDMLGEVTSLSQDQLMERIYFLGAAQSNKLLSLRDKYQAAANEKFKKTGRKPIINRLLKEIDNQKDVVADTQKQYQEYQELQSQQAKLMPELNDYLAREKKLAEHEQQLAGLKQKLVNYREYVKLQAQYQPIEFSETAFNKAQTAIIEINNLETSLKHSQEQLEAIKQQNKQLDFQKLAAIIDKKTDFLQWQSEYRRLSKEVQSLEQEIQQILQFTPLAATLTHYNDADIVKLKKDYLDFLQAQNKANAGNNQQLILIISTVLAITGLIVAFTSSNLFLLAIFLIIIGGLGIFYGVKQKPVAPNNEVFVQKYGFDPATQNLDEALQQMLQVKLKQKKLTSTKQEVAEYQQQLHNYLALVQEFYPQENLQLADLSMKLQQLQHAAEINQNHNNQIKTINEQVQLFTKQLATKKQLLLELFNHNKVKDFAEFQALKVKNEEQQQLKLKIDALANNLQDDLAMLQKLDTADNNFAQKEQELQQEKERITNQLAKLRQENAELIVKQQRLAGSDEVFKQKQTLANLQAELEQESLEYLADLAVSKWIARSLDLASNERFPKMLVSAKEYLRLLTGGRYVDLQLDKKLTVINQEHKKIPVEYLSRGTGEQLYFALKLAFIEQITDEINLPILIDDAFVNFDEQRTEYIEELLNRLALKTQVLIFTHRKDLTNVLNANVVNY